VQIDDVAAAGVQRRRHDGTAVVVGDAHMRDQRLIEDRVDDRPIVASALAPAAQSNSLRAGHGVRSHLAYLS
jgi:hypothetical protein